MSTTVSPGTPGSAHGATRRQRLSGVVQAVGKRPADLERRRGESLTVLAVFTVLYSVLGYWLVVEKGVVGFDALDRWARALTVVAGERPGLAPVGFEHPPLSVLLLVPLAVVPALTGSLAAVPVVSALFGAATMVVLNTMMRRARVTLSMRLVLLVAIGLNPLVVMYAATGARTFLWLAPLVAALGALFAWYVTADIRFVLVAGLAFAVAALSGYGSLAWFVVCLVVVAAVLARVGADGTEVEGTSVGFAAPTVYAVAVWSALNLLLVDRPFGWLADAGGTAAPGGPPDLSFLDVVRGTVDLVVHGAPVAVVVLPALVVVGLTRRNGFALWLGLVLLVSILLPGLAALLHLTERPMLMDNALPILLVAVVGGLWLVRSAVGPTQVVAGLLAAGLGLSVPWTFASMETFEHQGIERAFHDAVLTGESQEGVRTLDGSYVGTDHERRMAEWIVDHVDDPGSILTDDASTYAVILMTGRPGLFLDRSDESDESWLRVAHAPAGRVRHLLMSTNPRGGDLLSELYPDAAVGADPRWAEVFGNDRYVLVEVPADHGSDGVVDEPGADVLPDPEEAP